MSTTETASETLIVNIIVAVLAAGSTIATGVGAGAIIIAALQAAITLVKEYPDIKALVEKLESGESITTDEVKAAVTKAISADDALAAAIKAKLASAS